MTKILKATAIMAKVNDAFDEFQGRFNPQRLHEVLVDLCQMASRSVQFCAEITAMGTGSENSLEEVDVTGLPLGTTIMIPFGASMLQFALTSNAVAASIPPYVVKSNTLDGDVRTWMRSGSIYGTFDQTDLDENGILRVEHNFGFPLFKLLIFDSNHQYRPNIVYTPDPESPNNVVLVSINQGFEGNWSLLITY